MANSKSFLCTAACLGLVQASPLLNIKNSGLAAIQARQAPGFTPTGPFLGDFPDPTLIRVNDTWYAYSSQLVDPDINIPIASSPDLLSWSRVTDPASGADLDALPNPAPWVNVSATTSGIWAPDVAEWVPGRFTLLYSAYTMMDSREHCIGVATASTPTGPFTPLGTDPLICPLEQGGAIDASHFRDPETGDYYIAYKVDGGSTAPRPAGQICANNGSSSDVATPLMLQRVSDPQSFALDGAPTILLQNNGAADEGDIEAPSILYIPPLDGSGAPSSMRKRDEVTSLTTKVVDVTTTYCPEDETTSVPQGGKDKPTETPSGYPTTSPKDKPSGYPISTPPKDKTSTPSATPTSTDKDKTSSPSPTSTPSGTDKTSPSGSSTPTSTPPASPSSTSAPPPPPTSTPPSTSAPPPPPSSSSSSSGSAPPPPPSSSTSSAPPPPPSPSANGTYILFFSPGCFADTSYAVAYAVSTTGVLGPYVRHSTNLLSTGDGGLRSPGGLTATGTDPADRAAAIVNGLGQASAVYHAGIPAPNGTRSLYTAGLTWDGSNVAIVPPA